MPHFWTAAATAALFNRRLQDYLWAETAKYELHHRNTWEKLTRYETTLERSFHRNLHELQRLQAARVGKRVMAPVALDVDVSGTGKEG